MKNATVIEGQSLFDIAIAKCGTPEAAYEIAKLNGISMTDPLTPGTVLKLPDVYKKDLSAYFAAKNINPATAITTKDVEETFQGSGLEFWTIEEDFIIS